MLWGALQYDLEPSSSCAGLQITYQNTGMRMPLLTEAPLEIVYDMGTRKENIYSEGQN